MIAIFRKTLRVVNKVIQPMKLATVVVGLKKNHLVRCDNYIYSVAVMDVTKNNI